MQQCHFEPVRLGQAWPTLRLVHLPLHAWWLNQIELYFSIVQRKVLMPNDFASLDEVADRLLAFQHRYEEMATRFVEVHPGRPRTAHAPPLSDQCAPAA